MFAMRRRFLLQGSLGLAGLYLPSQVQACAPYQSTNMNLASTFDSKPLTRFAFGSCNYSDRDQSYWNVIAKDYPQLWIWLGDNIYGDGLTMSQRQQRYRELKLNRYYSALRSSVPVIGTWDDHDFASDNSDGNFVDKLESKKQLIEFLDISCDTGINQHSGIYQSYNFGPVGQRTKIILLDLRYNQDKKRNHRIILGQAQWIWLKQELDSNDFELLIIGSSLNVSSPTIGFGLEGWHAFTLEKQRLYAMLASVSCPTLLLCGDRHQADISRFDPGHGRQIYEFMSSGLTHWSSLMLPSPYRVSKIVGERNYGLIDIDWTSIGPTIHMWIKSPLSQKVLAEEWIRMDS